MINLSSPTKEETKQVSADPIKIKNEAKKPKLSVLQFNEEDTKSNLTNVVKPDLQFSDSDSSSSESEDTPIQKRKQNTKRKRSRKRRSAKRVKRKKTIKAEEGEEH